MISLHRCNQPNPAALQCNSATMKRCPAHLTSFRKPIKAASLDAVKKLNAECAGVSEATGCQRLSLTDTVTFLTPFHEGWQLPKHSLHHCSLLMQRRIAGGKRY